MKLDMLKIGNLAAAFALLATEVTAAGPYGHPHPAVVNETAGDVLAGEIIGGVAFGGAVVGLLGIGLFKICCSSQATATEATDTAAPINYGTQSV